MERPNRKSAASKRQQRNRRRKAHHGVVGHARPQTSQPRTSEGSQWHERPADERALIETFDEHARLRYGLTQVAEAKGEWAGIPMPLDGERLVVEPSYPYAGIGDIGKAPEVEGPPPCAVRNVFYSTRRSCDIVVMEGPNRRVVYGARPAVHHLDHDLHTLGCSDAWGIEQESNAVHTFSRMVRHRQFKQYMLTGMFLERSLRSGVFYLFRRLKPTVAMRSAGERMRILCALCLHPIAYYEGSWAGAMTPTDDVIAHLALMRGDEPMFWRRANQHAAHRPAAGL